MKIIAFAASSHTKSINKSLATYAAGLLVNSETEVLDLNDYEIPLFSEDREQELGQPQLAHDFLEKIASADALIISFAEHNGSYSAAYKNLFDWCSRINPKVYQDKPMILLSTSPGGSGGASVLAQAVKSMPFFSGDVKASLSIPKFHENFDHKKTIMKNSKIKEQLQKTVNLLL